jgi:N-acylneuraminate cytidylyltransferase
MIDGKKVLALIPARGGSKGIPRKNIVDLAGKPLLAWTIEEAKKSAYIDKLILSSDDDEIISVAREYGCDVPFKRPDELAGDLASGIAPVLHAIEALPGYDYVVLLQPTSPLRLVADIDGAIQQCCQKKAACCVSVTQPQESPYWMYTIEGEGRLRPLLTTNKVFARRQDLPEVYMLNGAVYVAQCLWLLKVRSFLTEQTIAYPMPQARSLDIDCPEDLHLAARLLAKNTESTEE